MKKLFFITYFIGVMFMPNLSTEASVKPKAQMKFLFIMCNDVAAIQKFYGETLGFETYGSDEEGFTGFDAGVHLIFFKGDFELPVHEQFAWQPGYRGGEGNLTSWSFEYEEDHFETLLLKLRESNAPLIDQKPEWRRDGYWGLTVKDPMGNTIELYMVPKERPEVLEWK